MTESRDRAGDRVQKIIAQSGRASRREAEQWIRDGRVTLNGRPCQLGERAVPGRDHIKIDGKLLKFSPTPVYFALHKPKGVIAMMNKDPRGRKTLKDLVGASIRTHVFPVGRMDYNGEGLILLTNDGEFAAEVQKNRKLTRLYEVKVDRLPDGKALERLARGTRIEGKRIKPFGVRVSEKLTRKAKVEAVFVGTGTLDVKALFELNGFRVERVVRKAFGLVELGSLPPGAFRSIKKGQIEAMLRQPELGLRGFKEGAEVHVPRGGNRNAPDRAPKPRTETRPRKPTGPENAPKPRKETKGPHPGGRRGGKPGGRPGGKPGGRPGGKPGGRPGGKPGGRPGSKPTGRNPAGKGRSRTSPARKSGTGLRLKKKPQRSKKRPGPR